MAAVAGHVLRTAPTCSVRSCSTWPALASFSEDWSVPGTVDLVHGVNHVVWRILHVCTCLVHIHAAEVNRLAKLTPLLFTMAT